MTVTLPDGLVPDMELIPVKDLVHDLRVNPRDPSPAWCRKQLSKGYNRALLGVFTASERPDGQRVLLDGGNRQKLMHMAADEQHPVQTNLFRGLTLEQEAQIAEDLNDRRLWTNIRVFQARCTQGDLTALRLQALFAKGGWEVETAAGPGIVKTVKPFDRLVATAGHLAAAELKARNGTEQWNAAMESGREDAFRVFEEAMYIFNAAFEDKPSGYATDVMYAIALVLLKYAALGVDRARLTSHLRMESKGYKSFRNDASGAKDAFRLGNMVDSYCFMLVTYYNVGLKSNAKAALPVWSKTAR
jgi:hypothetical protein